MATMDVDWGTVGSGAMSGAKTGSQIGSMFGTIGTAIGTGAGALLGGISGYFDSRSQLDSEERAREEYDRQFAMQNAEYDRRVADERAYNDPAAQANRLKAAGINPMSALGSFNVASNTAGDPGQPSTSPEPQAPARSQGLHPSEVLSMMSMKEDIEAKRLENHKRRVEIIGQDWTNKLNEQLYNYNKDNYPILLEAGRQKLQNSIQEYNNLVAKEGYDQVAADELRMRAQKEQEEIWLLQLQYYQEEQQIQINDATLKQMAQDLETGKFEQEYVKWHASHEKELSNIATTRGKITDAEWRDLWESGLMKEKTDAEKKQIEEMVKQLELMNDIWVTGKTDNIGGQLFRRLLYLATEVI